MIPNGRCLVDWATWRHERGLPFWRRILIPGKQVGDRLVIGFVLGF
jgi:hypothetical protein